MTARTLAGRRLACLAVTFLVGGCAAGASPTPAPTTTPAAAVTPVPSRAAADRTYVSGTMTCSIVGEEEPTTTGEHQPGTLYIDCAYQMSDPRVTGTNHAKLASTFVELEAVNGTSNFWASEDTLTAEDGTWTGSGFGSEFVSDPIKPMTLYTNGTAAYEGQGAFAGLTYRVLFARETPLAPGVAYVVSGWIEPSK
jgi:hypothetical protein